MNEETQKGNVEMLKTFSIEAVALSINHLYEELRINIDNPARKELILTLIKEQQRL